MVGRGAVPFNCLQIAVAGCGCCGMWEIGGGAKGAMGDWGLYCCLAGRSFWRAVASVARGNGCRGVEERGNGGVGLYRCLEGSVEGQAS